MIRSYLEFPKNFVLLIFSEGFQVVHIPFVCMVKFKFLAQFPVDQLPSAIVSTLCANLLHSLIMWLIISYLLPHNLHLLFCCVFSIFAFAYLVLVAAFCLPLKIDSISLLRFPFFSHVQVFSCKMSLVCCLKCPYRCFSSSHFCFPIIFVLLMLVLSVLFLVAIISILLRFLLSILYVASIHRRYLECRRNLFLLLFFITYSPCTSSLGCNAFCSVVNFIILWCICWSSSLVHFQNGPEYLTRGTAQVFIPLMKFSAM